jgi:hypothetical protein
MKQIKFRGTFTESGFKVQDQKRFDRFCSRNNGKEGWLYLVEGRLPRSLAQNAWYWGILIPAFLRNGEEDPHEVLKERFLSMKIMTPVTLPYCPACSLYFETQGLVRCSKCGGPLENKTMNVELPKAGSTTTLSVKEFSEYLEKCINYLKQCGGYLTTNEYDEYLETRR